LQLNYSQLELGSSDLVGVCGTGTTTDNDLDPVPAFTDSCVDLAITIIEMIFA